MSHFLLIISSIFITCLRAEDDGPSGFSHQYRQRPMDNLVDRTFAGVEKENENKEDHEDHKNMLDDKNHLTRNYPIKYRNKPRGTYPALPKTLTSLENGVLSSKEKDKKKDKHNSKNDKNLVKILLKQ